MRRIPSRCGYGLSFWMCVATVALANDATTDVATNTARVGLSLAASAADSWADDARLVWVENDTPLDRDGHASSWGYLYYSASQHAMRSWSVREGKIVAAVDHIVSAAAPTLEDGWQDSSDAATLAWKEGGTEFCAAGGELEHLLLARGIFATGTAWVAVFRPAVAGPHLYLVLDAASGHAVKSWRG